MTVDGVEAYVLELVRRHGSVSADVVIDAALYGTGGFYEAGGSAGGRGGDFLTSVEVGPLFGAVVARALDEWWEGMGRPDPFVVVDAGAGPGTLCRTVLAAGPSAPRPCATCSSSGRRRCGPGTPSASRWRSRRSPSPPSTPTPSRAPPAWREGPICVSLAKMPRLSGSCIVLANELLDNLPFGLAECRGGTWQEVRVTDDRTPWSSTWPRSTPRPPARSPGWHPTRPTAPGSRCSATPGAGCRPPFDVAGRRRPGRGVRLLRGTTAGAGRPPAGRVAAHLPRPRPGRPLARGPRHAGHHLRGRRRPARPRAPADRRPPPGRLAPRLGHRRAGRGGPAAVGRALGQRPRRRGPHRPQPRSPRPRRSPTPTG